MLHLAIVRSPVAHAKITQRRRQRRPSESPGVVAVFTGADLAEEQGSLPCAWPVTPDMVNPGHPSVAVDEVHHVGEAVAVIVARSKAAAQDAVELVDVDYDPLPVVLDMEEALGQERAPLPRPPRHQQSFHFVFDSGEVGTGGDVDQAIADAEVVVSRRFVQQRLIPAFMEPRSVVVQPQGDNYTMWSATQIPHILRVMLALVTGIPEHKLRVIAPDVGGGFGGKLQVTPEEILALVMARRLGKPVKWTETRSESLMTAHHGRDQIQYIDIAADREGNIKGLKVDLLADMGAYLRLVTPGRPGARRVHVHRRSTSCPAYRFDCTGVFTNKMPTDAYRGAGRPEATFAIERIMDELAVELGMDPIELRRKNWIQARGVPVHHGRRARLRQRRLRGGHREGAASCSATTSCAPSSSAGGSPATRCSWASASRRSPRCAGWPRPGCSARCPTAPAAGSTASIRMLPTGKVEVVTGSTPHGQGHETAWSQIVADAARRAVRGRRGAPRRHRDLLRRAWTPTAPGRWSSAASRW